MRKNTMVVLAALMALGANVTLPADASAASKARQTIRLKQHRVTYGYALQRVSVKAGCFPDQLNSVLLHIARKTGGRPIVTSGHRHGGRRESLHRKCEAADIRVPGVPVSRIIAAAATAPGIGGIGTYCNGIVHVDVGPRRRWRYC